MRERIGAWEYKNSYRVLCPNRNEDKMRNDFLNKEKHLKLPLR